MSMQRHKKREGKTTTKRKNPSHFSFNLSAAMQNNPYGKVMKEKERNNARTHKNSLFMGSQFSVRDYMKAWTKELKVVSFFQGSFSNGIGIWVVFSGDAWSAWGVSKPVGSAWEWPFSRGLFQAVRRYSFLAMRFFLFFFFYFFRLGLLQVVLEGTQNARNPSRRWTNPA